MRPPLIALFVLAAAAIPSQACQMDGFFSTAAAEVQAAAAKGKTLPPALTKAEFDGYAEPEKAKACQVRGLIGGFSDTDGSAVPDILNYEKSPGTMKYLTIAEQERVERKKLVLLFRRSGIA